MKVGTDGVLLGAWANVHNSKQILDIGTGSGLIALMLAQRSGSNSLIDAVEINKDAFDQACENTIESPWGNRIRLTHSPIQRFDSEIKYDLIVCNPPFFSGSLKSPDDKRTQSRHTSDLSFSDLLSAVKRLMQPTGIFCAILPSLNGQGFIKMAGKESLFCSRKLTIRTKPAKRPVRLLIELTSKSSNCSNGELILQHENGEWTDSYLSLVSPFYPWA